MKFVADRIGRGPMASCFVTLWPISDPKTRTVLAVEYVPVGNISLGGIKGAVGKEPYTTAPKP